MLRVWTVLELNLPMRHQLVTKLRIEMLQVDPVVDLIATSILATRPNLSVLF